MGIDYLVGLSPMGQLEYLDQVAQWCVLSHNLIDDVCEQYLICISKFGILLNKRY